ncbi:MAG: ABC transporter ATP-binding protein [Alphaproteobacteria bacterium]|nr:ABC transporter ATP-binding protein [Alphaproteobacteria bacterium]NDC56083.1 ABC transporter ATP-binding protein [Alphaproteobacteria bacterium]NDG04462.1 ABC transporter ATP-binding protein [Alphaproteobacteria bacterium]
MNLEKKILLPPPAVQCRGIAKHFGTGANVVHALRGVDLDIAEREVMMLVGPSGCGKTTLLSIIAGILTPSAGDCTVFDNTYARMRKNKIVAFRGKNVGFVFQQFNLLPALTVAENVAVPLIINGMTHAKAVKEAQGVLAEVGLGDRVHDMPNTLSGGQQQRVAIARALVHQPRLIVCDEPTSALDHETGARIMEMMCRAVHQRNTTLLVVTHDSRIFGYAHRIARMDDGKIIDITTPDKLLKEPGYA